MNFKNHVTNVDDVWVSLKVTSIFKIPGIPRPGHPGGVNLFEQQFWTPAGACDLGKQGDLCTKAILVTRSCWKFQKYNMVSRSLPPRLIRAIYVPLCSFDSQRYIGLVGSAIFYHWLIQNPSKQSPQDQIRLSRLFPQGPCMFAKYLPISTTSSVQCPVSTCLWAYTT